MRVGWFLLLNLHRGCLVAERTDEAVAVTILGHGDWYLGLDNGVDAPDLVCDLPRALEEEGVSNVAFYLRWFRHTGGEGIGSVSGLGETTSEVQRGAGERGDGGKRRKRGCGGSGKIWDRLSMVGQPQRPDAPD